MSHSKERKEKICLNCKTDLNGRFCHVCGQENIEPKESLWGLITHFFHDITHFDGKFFDTVKWLIRRPGFLSREYFIGRRASYLNPVRMYVFTSAFFFLLFFSFFVNVDNVFTTTSYRPDQKLSTADDTSFVTKRDTSTLKKGEVWRYKPAVVDSTLIDSVSKPVVAPIKDSLRSEISKNDTLSPESNKTAEENGEIDLDFSDEYRSMAHYDSVQKSLPGSRRDNWFERMMQKKEIELRPKFKRSREETLRELANKFIHYFPQLLFVSLPLTAMVLMLLYIRRRKEFYFVSHGIFLIHVYVYSFLNLTLFFIISKTKTYLGWGWLSILQFILVIHSIWYVYKAMRVFYHQGRLKTLVKFITLNLITFVILSILFTAFLLLSFWNM